MRTLWLLLLVACNGSGQRPDGGDVIDAPVVLVDASIDGPPDAAGFACADDSGFEPNNMISQAFDTPVDTVATASFSGLAVCPANDRDFYEVTLATPRSLEIEVMWTGGPDLDATVHNAAGTVINDANVLPDHSIEMCVPSLPAGTYYVNVFGHNNDRNNYRLTLTAKATCN